MLDASSTQSNQWTVSFDKLLIAGGCWLSFLLNLFDFLVINHIYHEKKKLISMLLIWWSFFIRFDQCQKQLKYNRDQDYLTRYIDRHHIEKFKKIIIQSFLMILTEDHLK